jgi:ATP-dependent exoDNAse (exonuclease V) beta subunit
MQHRLVRASAGTGKTYHLVQTYVQFVQEQQLSPHNIVAITFTKKAAAELRTRIRDELKVRGVLPSVLSDLAQAPLSNFHGLALRLLQEFQTQQKQLRPFEVLGEDSDAEALFVQACERAWFSGEEDVSTAVKQIAPYFNVDTALPLQLWQVLNLAREDGVPVNTGLLRSYDAAQVRTQLHGELLLLRHDLQAQFTSLNEKSRDKVTAFIQHPTPDLHDVLWSQKWQVLAQNLDRRGELGKFISPEHSDLLKERIFDADVEQLCGDLAPAMELLIERAYAVYQNLKDNRLDFADLVERATHLLATNVEFYQNCRQRFKAVLVDEAQDTNRLQRRFVALLVGFEGPAESEPSTLFVVGDRKQAIYTFRGADPQSFEYFAEDVLSRGGASETLKISRRSTPDVVQAINTLGEHLFGAAYETLEALEAQPHALPDVHWVECGLDISEPAAVAGYVQRAVRQGAAPGDFALLLATMPQAPMFARALNKAGIPVQLAGGGGFYQQQEIVEIAALLASLTDPFDNMSLAVALSSPLIGFSNAMLLELFQTPQAIQRLRTGTLHISKHAFTVVFSRWIAAAEILPPQQLLAYLEKDLQSRSVYFQMEHGAQRVANLDRLHAMAERYALAGMSSARFAHLLNERVVQEVSEPLAPLAASQSVTLCSIHQSKGLQFPVVLLAGLDKKGRNDTSQWLYDADLGLVFKPKVALGQSVRWRAARQKSQEKAQLEKARLLYVAVTRAERSLVFFADREMASKEGFAPYLLPWKSEALASKLMLLEQGVSPESGIQAIQTSGDANRDIVRLPAETRFVLPVTQIETYIECVTRGHLKHQMQLDTQIRRVGQDEGKDARERGQLAHAVLAALDFVPEYATLEAFVDAQLQVQGSNPEDLQTVKEDLLAFLSTDLGQRILRSQRRHHELPFTLKLAAEPYEILVPGQIDLLFWDGDVPVLVDYKYADAGGSASTKYLSQLEIYALAIWRMLGDRVMQGGKITALLVFLRAKTQVFEHEVNMDMLQSLESKIIDLAMALAKPRTEWQKLPLAACQQIECRFIELCFADREQSLDDKSHDMAARKLEELPDITAA